MVSPDATQGLSEARVRGAPRPESPGAGALVSQLAYFPPTVALALIKALLHDPARLVVEEAVKALARLPKRWRCPCCDRLPETRA